MKKLFTYIAILIMAMVSSGARAAGVFVKGLDLYTQYNAGDEGASLDFTIRGQAFKAIALWYEGSVAIAVEDPSSQRSVVYKDGSPIDGTSIPKIGFTGAPESRSNEYMIGVHDFTNDGEPELVIAVTDGKDGIAVFVLKYEAGTWKSIGNMVTKGKGLGGCRVFRQALTMKNSSGVLYTWTCHGDSFDFLSSDKVNDPTKLY